MKTADGSVTRSTSTPVRMAGALVLTLAAVAVVAFIAFAAFDFSATYGLSGTLGMALSVAFIVGLLPVSMLLLLARRLARLARPTSNGTVLVALAITMAAALLGAVVGGQTRARGDQAAASACEGDVGTDLLVIAQESGRVAAGGHPVPNAGVVRHNGSFTYGTTAGECIALVNADLDHVAEAARSLGWTIEGVDRLVSPLGVAVMVQLDDLGAPPDPDTHPVVQLTALP